MPTAIAQPPNDSPKALIPGSPVPRPWVAPVARGLIFITVLVIFWPLLRADFGGMDDSINLSHNPRLNPPTWQTLRHYWTTPEYDLYVPLTYTIWTAVASLAYSHQPDALGVNLNPAWFHATNLLLHVLSALAVFEILRRVVPNATTIVAMLGALVFALHPLQVEPVAWAAGLKDVLAGMLSLLAIWHYIAWIQCLNHARCSWHWAFGTIAFVAALLAKPSAVVVPAIVWVIDVLLLDRSLRRATLRALLWALLALPCIILTARIQPAGAIAEAITLRHRPLVASDALAFYLWKLIYPARLAFDYGRVPWMVIEKSWAWFTLTVPAAMLLVAWILRRRAAPLVASLLIFMIALLPVLGLVPFDFQAYSTVADHYVYLAMLGPALAMGWLTQRMPARLWLVVTCLLVILLGIRSHLQTRHWLDAPAIYNHALQINPQSWASHAQLAAYFGARRDFETALDHARKAAEINPDAFTVHNLIAQNLTQLGRIKEAIDAYRNALAIHPRDGLANINLANLLADQKQFEEAIRHYQIALEVNPHDAVAWANLGGVLEETGQIGEAIAHYRRAVSIDPNHLQARVALERATQAHQSHPTAPPQ